jgi:beta-glucosidase
MLVFDRLQDRVRTWTTLNEPWCSAMLGYYEGRQAPGRQNFADAMDAVHHLLLGHGLAAQRMRAGATQPIELGITLNMGTAMAATESLADQEAARRADGLGARIYLDPLLRGQYPGDIMDDLSVRGIKMPVVDGDLAIISEPIDVLGVNYYSSHRFSGVDAAGRTEDEDGNPISVNVPLGRPVTAMDWEIVPEGFTELLVRLSQEYPGTAMVITENGAAFDDEADPSGYVADHDRTAYLSSHIAAVAAARQQGADVRGYFAWSLMDNFEWSYGYAKRFGLVHVDYETQVRTPKQSALWYRDTVRRARGHQ